MSANDCIMVYHDPDGKYRGYHCMDEVTDDQIRKYIVFETSCLEEAIVLGQDEQTEYGVHFVNLRVPHQVKPS